MKKVLIVLMILLLFGCSHNNKEEIENQTTQETIENKEDTTMTNQDIQLTINDEIVEVKWEDNESIEALKELIKDSALTISTSMYGGFEQVGPIGTSLPSNDKQMTTSSGDIVIFR